MAASPEASSRRSAASSSASLKRSAVSSHHSSASQPSIPIDTLVNHLLAAKRSLSSMTLVLRANELANHARAAHEDTVILAAQTTFLRSSILDQVSILVKLRRSLQATYDWGKRDFKKLVRTMDETDGQLEGAMALLRGTVVQSGLRSKGEAKKSLLDFVDENNVHQLRDAMKRSIEELQVRQTSFPPPSQAPGKTMPKKKSAGNTAIVRPGSTRLRQRYSHHQEDAADGTRRYAGQQRQPG